MADYSKIYQSMHENHEYTAKELGVAPASMSAMQRRGLVIVTYDGSPKRYIKNVKDNSIWISELVKTHLAQCNNLFILHKPNEPYGMLCSLTNDTICDCWGNPYNVTDVTSVEINREFYSKE